MILLTPRQLHELRPRFTPDRPGPAVGLHVLQTGHGACYADRWPNPRALIVYTTGNYSLTGDPDALTPCDVVARIDGVVDAPEAFVPLLRAAFPNLVVWEIMTFELPAAPVIEAPAGASIRRLELEDVRHLWGLCFVSGWIARTWSGPPGVAASGKSWGAFVDGRLASVALSYYVGERYENLAVVTEPAVRGRGLGGACVARLAHDVESRGRRASWTSWRDNRASLRVAQKLGFVHSRDDYLYATGIPVPNPSPVSGQPPPKP